MKSIKPLDIIVIFFILLFTVYFLKTDSNKIKNLLIVIENKKYSFSLEENRVIDLKAYGRNIKIEVKDKKARFIESDCKDKICIHMGYIKDCGDSAICLPNKTAIVIECSENSYDSISR